MSTLPKSAPSGTAELPIHCMVEDETLSPRNVKTTQNERDSLSNGEIEIVIFALPHAHCVCSDLFGIVFRDAALLVTAIVSLACDCCVSCRRLKGL